MTKKASMIGIIAVLAAATLLLASGNVLAGWGRGAGDGPGGCPFADGPRGEGKGAWGSGGQGANLDEKTLKKLEENREKFQEDTADLRREIYQKDLELRSILAEEKPSLDKARKVQKDLSDLKAKMDQKWIVHRIEMDAICPFDGQGPGAGRGQGRRGGGCCR